MLGQRIVSFEEPVTVIPYDRICGGKGGVIPLTTRLLTMPALRHFRIRARHTGLGGVVGEYCRSGRWHGRTNEALAISLAALAIWLLPFPRNSVPEMQHCSGGCFCPCASNVWWYTTIFPGRTGSRTTQLASLEKKSVGRAPRHLPCIVLRCGGCAEKFLTFWSLFCMFPPSHRSHEYDEIDVRCDVKFGTQEADIWLIVETE